MRSVAPVASRAIDRPHGRCCAGPAYPLPGLRDACVRERRRARNTDANRRTRAGLLAAVRALHDRRRAGGGDEPHQRTRIGAVLQSFARHAAHVWIELDQNLFAPSSPRVVTTPVTGGTEILRVAAAGQALASRDTGAGYSIYATNMELRLPRALVPRDSVDLDIAWAFQLPPDGAPREGTTGDVFMVAYWYPRLAVYDDVIGWQNDPYLGTAEFYMGYADYDVN